MTTPNVEERATFPTEEAARQAPAMLHALSFYEVEAVPFGRGARDAR